VFPARAPLPARGFAALSAAGTITWFNCSILPEILVSRMWYKDGSLQNILCVCWRQCWEIVDVIWRFGENFLVDIADVVASLKKGGRLGDHLTSRARVNAMRGLASALRWSAKKGGWVTT
jgi:hypothetical protein